MTIKVGDRVIALHNGSDGRRKIWRERCISYRAISPDGFMLTLKEAAAIHLTNNFSLINQAEENLKALREVLK